MKQTRGKQKSWFSLLLFLCCKKEDKALREWGKWSALNGILDYCAISLNAQQTTKYHFTSNYEIKKIKTIQLGIKRMNKALHLQFISVENLMQRWGLKKEEEESMPEIGRWCAIEH